MNKYLSRLTSSDQGGPFHFLVWPFLMTTFSYGVGFSLIYPRFESHTSSLHDVMYSIAPWLPLVWGISCLLVIVTGLAFLLFRQPLWGRFSCVTGFMLWIFAAACYAVVMNIVIMFAVAIPQAMFWGWQWFTIRRHHREEMQDKRTMKDFDQSGGYHSANNN